MKSNLRKALALLLTLIMVMTSLPTSALAEMFAEASQSIQPFAGAKLRSVIKPDDEDVYVTFTFKNEGNVVDTQIINRTNGETLKEPATPAVPEGKRFDGWYVGETKLDFSKVDLSAYTGEVTVDARFTKVYYVYFLDKEEKYVYYTAEVTGNTVTAGDMTAANQYEFKDSILQGWINRDTSTAFTEDTLVTGDTYVIPVTIPAYWITFNTDGGTGVPSQYVAQGESIDLSMVAAPTKLGYAFVGWKDENDKDVTNTTITPKESMTLKAQWTASQVKYTVVYWGENADDTNYSVLATDANKTAFTGTELTLDDSTGALPTVVEKRQHFTFERSDTVTIAADGSSVLNVYYKRNTYTLTFPNTELTCNKVEHAHSHDTCCTKTGFHLSCNTKKCPVGYEHTHSNKCFSGDTVITAKYDSDIAYVWGTDPIKSLLDQGCVFRSSVTGKYYSFLQKMPEQNITMTKTEWSGDTYTWYYYLEVLPEQDTSGLTTRVDKGKTYYLYHTTTVKGDGISLTYDEDYFPITGFKQRDNTVPKFQNRKAYLYYLRDSFPLKLINYGSETSESILFEADISKKGAAPSTAPDGYTAADFKGWYEVSPKNITTETTAYDFKGKTMPAKELVLYAYYAKDPITVGIQITVNADNEFNVTEEIPAGKTIADSQVYADALTFIAAHNLVLLKWVDADGERVNIEEPLYESKTIRPIFSGTTYTLTYVLGEGATDTVPVDGHSYGPDSLARVMGTDATLNGQPFAYWTNAADAAGTRYYPGSYIVMTADTTLTAHYAPLQEKVSVTYHANYPGSNPESVEQHQKTLNNGTIEVLRYEATGLKAYVGYTFQGWATTSDGSVVFAAGASARVNNQEPNNLYAVWAPSTNTKYTVQYYWQNVNDDNFTLHEEDELYGTTGATATADEKTYTGLKLNKEVDGTLLSGTIAADGSLVLKLYYIRDTYTVTFNRGEHGHLAGEDADGNVTTANLRYGADTPAAPTVTPDAGYTFSDVWNPAIAPKVTGDATYTAQYAEEGNVTISYTVAPANGGRVSSANESLPPATGEVQGSTATAKPGWKFTGWTLNQNEAYSSNSAQLTPAKGDVDGSAIWTERTYVAHFERTTAALTVEKQWLDDEGYTDNRVPVTLTIGRRADNVEDTDFTRTVSLTTTVLSETLQVETHHENGTPYTYYIKKEKATNADDQAKLNTYYSSDLLDTANLTTTDKTLTAKNTLATKELTIAKAINPDLPKAYKSERFAFAVAKVGDSTPVLLMKKNADNSVEPIDKIELTNAESITLILPIGTYTVSEVLTDAQKEVWQAQPYQTVTLPDKNSVVFTNTVKTGEITVNKVWVDEKSAHSDVTVSVTGSNGFRQMETFASSKTFEVPLRNADGTEAKYMVLETDYGREGSTGEVDDSGFYQTFYKVEGGSMSAKAPAAVPANKDVTVYNVEMGNVQIQKKWDNYYAEDIAKLYDVEGELTYTVLGIKETVGFSITAGGNWKTTKRVPLYTLVNDKAEKIAFEVVETGVYLKNEDGGRGDSIMGSFTPSYDQASLTITNTYTADDGYRAISVNKEWVRPAYMTTDETVAAEFTLYRYTGTGNAQAELNDETKWVKVVKTITLSEPATDWTPAGDNEEASNSDTFARVPRYDASGAEIVYAVKEAGVLGDYTPVNTAAVVGKENAVSFRNVMNEAVDALILTKKAYDVDGTELHAGTFTFEIRRGDARAKTVTIDLAKGDRTSVRLVPGAYTVAEIGAAAWTTSYTVTGTTEKTGDDQTAADVLTDSTVAFENRRISADAFTVTKYWVGENPAINVRPSTTDYVNWLTFYQKKGENGQWEEYDATPTIGEAGSTYTITYTGMPKAAADGTPFTYAMKETPSSYYTLTATTNPARGLDNAVLANGSMTNTLNSGSLTITKNLVDASGETYSADFTFTVKLDGVNGSVTKTVTADSATKTGTATVDNLPVGSYTVTEATVNGWTATSDPAGGRVTVAKDETAQVTFTNTRRMFNGNGKYTVVKKWQRYDENEAFPNVTIELSDGARTRSVELKSEDVEVDGQNASLGSVSHIFENLPAYDLDGKKLTYTATESYIPGYTAGEPASSDVSTTFTNTADGIELKVYKEWKNGDGTKYTGKLPESLTVELWRKGEDKAYDSMTLTAADADENGRWYSTSNFDFPKYDVKNGKDYEYYVHEVVPEDLGFEPEANDLSTFVKNEESDDLYSVTLVNQKTMSEEVPSEKTVEADFKTVQITDDATGKMVEDGAQLTYTITYFNHFSDPKTIVITDTLDPNVSFDPADNPGVKSYDADSRTVTWEIPDVQPGTGDKVELTVRVALTDEAKATSDPKIPNTATVKIGNDATQTAESENVTVYHPRLKVEKITANVPAKGYYALGETAEFKITASNTGNVLLENIVITEQLKGAQFVQSDDYTVEDDKAIIAALNPGQSVVVRAQYTVKYDDLYAEDDQQQAPMKNIVTATAQSGDDPVDGGDESEFKPDQRTHLTVEKHWADDLVVQRGDVRVQLTADGASYTADSRYDHEVIISSEDNLSPADENVWVMEFDNLPKHNANGSEIRYSAVETHVDGHGNVTDGRCDGYDVTVADDPAAHTTVITNTPQRKEFTVRKVWMDGEGNLAESLIPDTELTVALFVDGFDMDDDDFRTTLTRANGWTGEIHRMFAYNQAGVAYEYTPMEMDANGNAIADGGSIVIDGVTYDVSITTQTVPDANRAEAHRDVIVTVTNTRRGDDPEENKPTKEANLAPGKTTVSVGDSLTYTISYHNSRNVKADVTITDVLAESLNFGSASHGGTYDPDTRTVTWVLRDVAAFASDAVTLTVTVNEKAKQADDAAAVKNTATVVIPGNEAEIRCDTNTVDIPVEPEEGVKPTKKAVGIDPAKDTVEIGQKVEYRIGYRNHKNTAVSVRIVDKLDDGVKFISASDGGVYDAAKHTVIWNIAKLAPFADGEVTLTVEVTEAARELADGETMATVKNTATVKFDNDPETETNVVDIPVKPNDPKKPEKKAEGLNATDTKKVGDEIVYTITYVNNLNKKAKVVVTDALDEGVDFVEADNGGVYDKASHTVTWTFDSVDPFEGDAVKLTVKVNEKARQIKEGETTATVDNTAAVTVDNKTTTISDPVEIPVTPDKPTDPTKKADDKALNSFGKIAVGDQLPFTVSYVNNLNTVATVTVRDTLEEGLTFVSADNGGTYDEATRTVTWVLKDVAPFTSGSVTVITEVNENAVDAADPTVANSAVVKIGDQPEQTTEPAEVTVYNPDFSVEKKLTNLPAKGYFTAGETAAFDITVKNTGNVPLENVAVEELLDGAAFVQGEGYTIDGRIATIAALPIGEQIVLKAEYTVIEADLGNTDLANRITVRGEVPENPDDPDQPHNPEDKGDEEPIPVDECVEITGTKTWNDADNAYGARPDVILVMLLANGEEKIGTRASAETEWKYTFIQQPKHDADGNEVVYSIREEEVPGYDTTYSAEDYDITNTLRRHTLTIRYWIDEVGGEQAFKTFTRDYYYGERYNVVSPAMDGYRADHEVVSGRIEGDLEVDVVYTAILWRLNIRYRRVGDGKTLAPMYTNGSVIIGDAYEVESPVIPGYTADRPVVKGEMHGRNMSFTVWYTPEQTEVVIVDEKTPFGLGNVVMNAGDCFE